MKKIVTILSIIVILILSLIIYLFINVPINKEILKTKELIIPLGESKQIDINTKAKYNINDNQYISVNTNGNVKGIKKGKAIISVKTEKNEYFIPVEVVDSILDINVFDHIIEITKGNSQKLNLILKNNVKIKSYEYDKNIINIENEVVKGINIGKTNLRIYTNNNTYVDLNIVVNEINININKLETTLFINNEDTLEIYTNSTIKPIWSSTNENIVTVNNGIIKGINIGESIVSATIYDKTISCHVKVVDKIDKIKLFKLNKAFINLNLNETFEIKPYIEPNIPNNLIKYEILDNSVVRLENNKIIALKNGKTILKASIYNKEYYMTIYVGNISKNLNSLYKIENIMDIFDEVALAEEYISRPSSTLIQKWNSPIYYYYKNASVDDIKQIKKIAQLLNDIPEFPGMFEANSDQANLIIDFVDYNYLHAQTKVAGVEGYSENTFAGDNIITKSNIMINYDLNQNIKNSVIAEEILHSIGLKNDTKKFKNSVLYDYGSLIEYPTDMDIILINILYDKSITYGMDINTVNNKIKSILK